MSSMLFFSVGTIGQSTRLGRKPSTLLGAARHNHRAIQAERGARSHIDPTRTHLNESIAGPDTPEAVVALAKSLMTEAGVAINELRKDYAQAVELLFSLPADTSIDTDDYFRRCLTWAGEKFGCCNVLSATIHRDEASPHCHVLILPLANGRMRGSHLITRPALAALRKSFAQVVARVFGLKEPPRRLSGATHGQAVGMVLEKLESSHDAILKSGLWSTVRRDIERDPARFIAALGLELPTERLATKKPVRTMTQIFTSPGKGGKIERGSNAIGFDSLQDVSQKASVGQRSLKPIGFEDGPKTLRLKHRNLSCVGFAQESKRLTSAECTAIKPALPTSAELAISVDQAGSGIGVDTEQLKTCATSAPCLDIMVSRERYEDQISRQWNRELGEFVHPPAWSELAARER